MRTTLFHLKPSEYLLVLVFILLPCGGAGAAWNASLFAEASFDYPFQAGGWLYFIDRAPEGHAVWRTDGTASGTGVVRQFPGAYCSEMALFEGSVYFLTSGDGNVKLWKTVVGSGEVTTAVTLPDGVFDHKLLVAGDLLYFAIRDEAGYPHLYRTDGTEPGTLSVDPEAFWPVWFVRAVGNRVLFGGYGGSFLLLGSWDGTPGGPQYLGVTTGIGPGQTTADTGTVFFTDYSFCKWPELECGSGLWKTDGTPEGTVLVKALTPCGGLMSTSSGMFVYSVNLYYSDGTEAGTIPLFTPHMPEGVPAYGTWCVYKDSAYFGTYGPPFQLWKSNGTVEGTVKVKDFEGPKVPFADFPLSSKMLFEVLNLADNTMELCQTYGTTSGTRVIKHFEYIDDLHEITESGSSFFFTYSESDTGIKEVWVSDSTSEGTYKVPGVVSKSDPSDHCNLVYFNDMLFFKANGQMWACGNEGTYACGEGHVVVDELADLAGYIATNWPEIESGLASLGFTDSSTYDLESVHLILGGVLPPPPEGEPAGDGWYDWFELRLVEFVLCNEAFWAHDMVSDLFRHNQDLFGLDMEDLYAQSCTPENPEGDTGFLTVREEFRNLIPALMLLSGAMRSTVDGILALGFGDTSAPYTILPRIDSYATCCEGSKVTDELFGPDGDLDRDGILNTDEYASAMAATGDYEVALMAITDEDNFWPGNPALPATPLIGLAAMAATLFASGVLAIRRK